MRESFCFSFYTLRRRDEALRNLKYILVTFLFAALILTSSTQVAVATTVWSDNFDDGDVGDWVVWGCNTTEGYMRWEGETTIGVAMYNSSTSWGTWKFDLIEFDRGAPASRTRVRFITNVDRDTLQPWQFYYLELMRITTDTGTKPRYSLAKNLEGELVDLGTYDGPESELTTHHIKISREDWMGQINVYVNDTIIMQVDGGNPSMDPSFVYGVFHFATERDVALDNVVVDGEADAYTTPAPTTTPTPTTTAQPIPMELLLIGGGVAAAAIVVLVIILKRRS